MKQDYVDEDRGAIAFPLTYCLVCRAPLEAIVSLEGNDLVQKVSCPVCHSMSGKLYLRNSSLLAVGQINVGAIEDVYDPSFLLHQPKTESHHTLSYTVWTAKAI